MLSKKIRTRYIRLFMLAALLLTITSLQTTSTQAKQLALRPMVAAPTLASVLNADGTLNLKSVMKGSFDARGWLMKTDAQGKPRFVKDNGANKPGLKSPLAPQLAGDQYWDSRFVNGLTAPGTASYVYAIASYQNDVYVGGYFTRAGGIAANSIARWSLTDNRWHNLGGGIDGIVYSIVPNGKYVYVGGSFNDVEGKSASSLARWDTVAQTWSIVGGIPGLESAGKFAGVVEAMAFDGSGNLYVGGNFDHAGSVAAQNIAMWNGVSWSAFGGGLGAAGEVVLSLAISGSDVFAGGNFTAPYSYIAHRDGSSWSSMGGMNGPVFALAINGSSVYAGGRFSMAGITDAQNIALWMGGSNWQPLGSGTDSYVTTIVLGPDGYYVGGNFITAGGNPAKYIAKWSGSAWTDLGSGLDGEVFAIVWLLNDFYMGGGFTNNNGGIVNHIASWEISPGQWHTLGNSVSGSIRAVAVNGNDVYIGGVFNTAGGINVNNLAKYNSLTGAWSDVGGGVGGCTGPSPFCVTSVDAIAVNGTDVYVGGTFSTVGISPTVPANGLARWDTLNGIWVGGHVDGCNDSHCSPAVNAIVAHGGGVDVGGEFNNAGCAPGCTTANNVVYWDGNAFYVPFSDGTTIGTNGAVSAMLYDGSGTYVGGGFTSPRPNLVYFDGNNWFGIGSQFNFPVTTLAEDANYLYAGGFFTNVAGSGTNYIARLNLTNSGNWEPMGSGFNDVVLSLGWNGNDLIAAGQFTQSGLTGTNRIARWDRGSESWLPTGSGVNDQIDAVAGTGSEIYVGGFFTSAGGKESDYFARWALLYYTYLPAVER